MPIVSVIIPTCNRTHYLQKAIDSVLGQSETDIEIIVVDDGSQDGTAQLVEKYTDIRVHYLHQENAGRSAARNKGIRAAAGRFISFLDDDDVHCSSKIKTQLAFLAAHPHIDAVASTGYLMDEHDNTQGILAPWKNLKEITLPECIEQSGIPPSSLLLRRRSLDRMEYWFDQRLSYAEDNDFVIRFLLSGHRLTWLPEPLWKYRRHSVRTGYMQLASVLSFHTVLERLFVRSDLAGSILEKKNEILSRSHTAIARFAYLHHMVKLGRYHLEMAVALDPLFLEDTPPRLSCNLSEFGHALSSDERERYCRCLCSNLPEPLLHLRPHLHEAMR